MVWIKFVLCVFFGLFGVHKFMEKKIGMGILYFFTMGLFGFGWMYDCIKYLVLAIRSTRPDAGKPVEEYEREAAVSAEYAPAEIRENHGFSMKKGLLALLSVFLLFVALSYLPHISGILALLAAVIAAPMEKWQQVLSRFIRGKRKGILVTAMIILALILTPASDCEEAGPADLDAEIVPSAEVTKQESATAAETITVAEILPEKITIAALPQAPQRGSGGRFAVEFEPLDVTDQELSWESDAPEVLLVNEDGSYEARSIGTATITAAHKNGTVGTIQVEVVPVAVETITLSCNWEEGTPFCKNDSMTLLPEINPEDAAEKSLTWYSSDETVATVSDEGVVTAGSPGTATITAEAANGITGTCEITVDPSPQTFRVSASSSMKSNNHVGNRWISGFEVNGEALSSGSTVSLMPGETFTVCGWAQDNDSKPDYGAYRESVTLTDEMCKSGFTVEGEAYVYENGGRYSGNCAVWTVKITFTPIN